MLTSLNICVVSLLDRLHIWVMIYRSIILNELCTYAFRLTLFWHVFLGSTICAEERVDMDIIAFDSPWLIASCVNVAGNSPQVDWGLRAGSVLIKASSRLTVSAWIYASCCTLWRL